MKFFIYIAAFLFFQSIAVYAQDSPASSNARDPLGRLESKQAEGSVRIKLDSLIEENYQKHLVQNAKNRGVEGYRIRIFSDNGYGAKENQKRTKARFMSLYPDIAAHDDYETYYKIYVGDFRTRRDALKVLDKIKKNFPDAFIVEDIINIEE